MGILLRKILFLLFLLLLASMALGYEMQGNSVIQEDELSKLKVYPSTAWDPTKKNYEQIFELTNKTNSTKNVYIGYRFDEPLINGEVYLYVPPVFSWVNGESFQCNPPFIYDYNLNSTNDLYNKHHAICYQILDNNGTVEPYNKTIWETNFSSGDLVNNLVTRQEYKKISDGFWRNVSEFFNSVDYMNDKIYFTPSPVIFDANEVAIWKIKYTPTLNSGKKWELAYYSGASANCIVNNTCSYVNWLDPWFDPNYTERYPLNIASSSDERTTWFTESWENVDTSTWACVGDNNKMAFVRQDTLVQIDAFLEGVCGGDMNFFVRMPFNLASSTAFNSSDSNGIYVYNTTQTVSNPMRDYNKVFMLYDGFEDGDISDWNKLIGDSASTATDYSRSGVYSMKLTPASSSTYIKPIPTTHTEFDHYYVSMFFDTSTTNGGSIFGASNSDASVYTTAFRTWTDAKLRVYASAGWINLDGNNAVPLTYKWLDLELTEAHPSTPLYDGNWFNTDGVLEGYKYNYSPNNIASPLALVLVFAVDQGTTWFDNFYMERKTSAKAPNTIGAKESAPTTPTGDVNQGIGYEQFFNNYDERADLNFNGAYVNPKTIDGFIPENKYVNPKNVEDVSPIIKKENDQNNLILASLILSCVIILLLGYIFVKGRK